MTALNSHRWGSSQSYAFAHMRQRRSFASVDGQQDRVLRAYVAASRLGDWARHRPHPAAPLPTPTFGSVVAKPSVSGSRRYTSPRQRATWTGGGSPRRFDRVSPASGLVKPHQPRRIRLRFAVGVARVGPAPVSARAARRPPPLCRQLVDGGMVTTILPFARPCSTYAIASRVSSNGNVRSSTGRSVPAS